MIYECPQCGDVFQTDVPAPVCDNCGGPMRETVGDFDPETGALWHVWRMDPIDARLEANRLWQELREVATALGNVGCPTPQMDALRNDLTARLRSAADDVHALVVHPSTARKPATPAPAAGAGGDALPAKWRNRAATLRPDSGARHAYQICADELEAALAAHPPAAAAPPRGDEAAEVIRALMDAVEARCGDWENADWDESYQRAQRFLARNAAPPADEAGKGGGRG